jgi:hypothetical protein
MKFELILTALEAGERDVATRDPDLVRGHALHRER